MNPSRLKPLRISAGLITQDEVASSDADMLTELAGYKHLQDFRDYCAQNTSQIEELVASHLGLKKNEGCTVAPVADWKNGSFNLVIPIDVQTTRDDVSKRVVIRFPLDHRTGELSFPGNSEEKLRCEAATYLWMHSNCPDIPLPRLFGFAFVKGVIFSRLNTTSRRRRWSHWLRLFMLRILGRPVPCQDYIAQKCPTSLQYGYLLLEYIEPSRGTMLSRYWCRQRRDGRLCQNLLGDLSRIMLSMTSKPLERIGSFTISDDVVLSLSNRPLSDQIAILESGGIPSQMQRAQTYNNTESYLIDVLNYHDNKILYQPNAIEHEEDGREQMTNLSLMRTLLPQFTLRNSRSGPFFLALTDLHRSNILVDQDWHITCLIDLEWACSVPMEMIQPPTCLWGSAPDALVGDQLEDFKDLHKQFETALTQNECHQPRSSGLPLPLSQLMRNNLENAGYFYFLAMQTVTGLYNVFEQHIRPFFSDSIDAADISCFWKPSVDRILSKKMEDKVRYDVQLIDVFKE